MENDLDIQKEILNLSKELQEESNIKKQQIGKSIKDVERVCFCRGGGMFFDVLVTCLNDVTTKIEKERKKLELRNASIETEATECLINGDRSQESIRKCKINALSNMQLAFDTFKVNINPYP